MQQISKHKRQTDEKGADENIPLLATESAVVGRMLVNVVL